MALIDWLSSYYKEENSNDSYGWRNFTDTNITYWTWAFWNCAIFNGTTSKQTGTHWLWTWNIDFSYYWWIYVTWTQTRWEILSIWNHTTTNQWIHFSVRTKSAWNDAIYFDYSNTAGSSTTARVTYNAWNFIWIKKSWSSIYIRVGNNAFETFSAPATLNITTSTMIFWDYWAWLAYFNWKIDEAAIFTTVKTDNEFVRFYNWWTPFPFPYRWLPIIF